MELTANCVRDGKWWIVRVPEIRGLFTQVRRLDQVVEWVTDAASMLDDQPEDGWTVTVVPQLGAQNDAVVTSAKLARERLRHAESQSAETNRTAITHLSALGLSTRDIGAILGLSHQRVQQIVASAA